MAHKDANWRDLTFSWIYTYPETFPTFRASNINIPDINIQLSDEEASLFARIAEAQGTDTCAYIRACIAREAQRLYYIERAKPKPPKEPSPIGRPPLSAEHKEARKLGRSLQDIYLKLKTLHDEQSWQRLFGSQYAHLETMMQGADLDGLRTMFKEQPWTKRTRK